MMHNIIYWMAAFVCAVWGVGCFYAVSRAPQLFGYGTPPLATRMVFFVGPLGWLLFFLFGALLILRFRGSRPGQVLAICLLSAALAIGTTLLFTPFTCPGFKGDV